MRKDLLQTYEIAAKLRSKELMVRLQSRVG